MNAFIPVSYFLRVPNFGDRLNADLTQAISGLSPVWNRDSSSPHLLAIGSAMAGASPQSQVWGTGVMHPDMGLGHARAEHIHALRGPLSAAALKAGGLALRDVPLGDPAVLAPRLLGIARSAAPRFRVGLVPHYVDRQNPIVRAMLAEEGVCLIDVHADPVSTLRAMADCESILSTSLHGLVLAEALGLPNIWLKAGNEIAGEDFKFADWFATTAHPQKAPHGLVPGDSAIALAERAETHDSLIDHHALLGAFPHNADWSAPPRAWRPVSQCRAAPTPVFLISFNRGPMLRRVVDGLQALADPVQIIVHDNGSDDPATLETLEQLEREGVIVWRYPAITSPDQLDQVNESVDRYFSDWAEPVPYVVSDCDVDISTAAPDVLAIYRDLLNTFRKVACVGPMLRIRDIPQDYPLRNRALNRHIEQFWRHEPQILQVNEQRVALQFALIDTTFALHRAGERFHRLKAGIRVYEPYEALHLDWYTGAARQGQAEHIYAATSNPAISHWNNTAEQQVHEGAALDYDHFIAVRLNAEGQPEAYRVPI